jgi:hypothetical protein
MIASVCLFGGAANAAEPQTIVLVSDHADASVTSLLREELINLGLNVLVVDRGDHELSPGELIETARQNHAFAAFRVLVGQGKMEVWLADRMTGKVLLREVLRTPDKPSGTSQSAAVARAVELLRASLLELDVDDRPAGEVERPKTLPPALRPPAPRAPEPASNTGVALNTSFILLGASLSTAPSPGIGVALRWQALHNFSLVGRVAVPLTGPDYTIPEGHAQLTPRFGALSLRLNTNAFSGGFRASAETGFGLLWTRAVGVAAQGYSAFIATDIEPVPFLGGELSYSATRNIAFAFGVLGGPGIRPTKYVVTNDETANQKVIGRYGRWVGLASLGLDVMWN